MTSQERRWCLALAGILALATSIPYVIGFQAAGSRWVFTGFVFGVEDGNSYVAKMLQGAAGAWLFRTPYSAQPGGPILAFLPYLLLGKLVAGSETHLQLVVLFHLARIGLMALAVVSIYRFVSVFLPTEAGRRWATILATAGGGLGWVLVSVGQNQLFGSLPLDLYSPEAFGFLAFYGLPHLLLAKSLLLLALTLVLENPSSRRSGIAAAGLLLGAGLAQPLSVVTGYVAAFVFVAVDTLRNKPAWRARLAAWQAAGWAVVGSAPIVLYYGAGSVVDSSLRQWTAQNILVSPPPVHYLLAYGLILAPAAIGVARPTGPRDRWGLSLAIWAAASVALAYLPVTVQRRLVDGAWPALVILAARGLFSREPVASWVRRAASTILILSLGTTVLLLAGGIQTGLRPGLPAFRSAEEVEAFETFRVRIEPGSVVLASFDTGNVLPAFLPVRSVVGHGPETVDLQELRPRVEAFFDGSLSESDRADFLSAQGVDYVFYGPLERSAGGWGVTPEVLTEVGRSGGYVLYRVQGR